MALKWKDKVDGEDWVLAEDINAIAKAVRDVEGVAATKLDKPTEAGGIWAVTWENGKQKTKRLATSIGWGYALPMYDDNSTLKVNDPTLATGNKDFACANKKYVNDEDNAIKKRLDLLELAAEGNIFAFVEDDSAAYAKSVPSTAFPNATIDKLGGAIGRDEFGLLVESPVTKIENHGKNLFNESAITIGGNESGKTDEKYGVVENGYLKAKYGRYGDSILWYPFSMYLKSGTYTISADVYIGNSTPNLVFDMGVKMAGVNGTSKSKTLYFYDVWERVSVTVTVATEGNYYFLGVGHGSAENYTKCDVRFKNIQIERGETATDFAPYREPITYEIPQAIRNLAGYGLGIDKNINNYIDFEAKTYTQMVDQRLYEMGEEEERSDILTDAITTIYPLDAPVVTDISDKLTFDGDIEVEQNGAIVAVNEYKAAIPSTITFQVKL